MAAPHRAMFLAGGAWAIVAVGLVSWNAGIDLTRTPLGGPAAWHAHEMVFGFAAVMFAGYALTAMTGWPGNPGLSFTGATGLLVLWALARFAAAGAFGQDPRLVVPAAAAFMICVTLTLARAALGSASSKGAVLALFALALTGVQVAVLRGAIMPHIPVFGFAALLSMVGGRIVAAFTWNRLAGGARLEWRFRIARLSGLFGASAILLAPGLDILGAAFGLIAVSLLVAALAEAIRVSCWMSPAILKDGLLVMLHAGYSWLPLGLILVALDQRSGESAALHALTAGAVACTIYAVAARAVARRADRLRPTLVDGGGFVLLWMAAALRVFAPVGTTGHEAAPVIWCMAWAVFLGRHGAALLRPAPRPVFSGPKRPAGSSDVEMAAAPLFPPGGTDLARVSGSCRAFVGSGWTLPDASDGRSAGSDPNFPGASARSSSRYAPVETGPQHEGRPVQAPAGYPGLPDRKSGLRRRGRSWRRRTT